MHQIPQWPQVGTVTVSSSLQTPAPWQVLCRPWLRAPSSNRMLRSMGGGQRPMGLGSEFFRLLHDLHLLAFPTKCIWIHGRGEATAQPRAPEHPAPPATAVRGRDAASQNLKRRPGSGTEARRLQGAEPSRLLRTYAGGAVIPTGTPERTQPPPPQDPLGRRRWLYRNTWGPWPGTTQPPSPQLLRNDWGSCGFMVPEAARGKVFQDSQEGAHILRETVSKSVCAEPRSHQRARDPAPPTSRGGARSSEELQLPQCSTRVVLTWCSSLRNGIILSLIYVNKLKNCLKENMLEL
nr:putative protein FAM157B [Gorilla gorilla gorilla]